MIKMMIKFYHYYQIQGKAPWQFNFTLKKDVNFNYKIIVDIIYLDKKPVFHLINIVTTFQTGQYFNNISAKDYVNIRLIILLVF